MPIKEKDDEHCSAKIRDKRVPEEWDQDIAYCANPAGFRTDHFGDGKCYLHGGATPAKGEANYNAEKHGLYTERQPYYERRSEQEKAWMDAVAESLMDDLPESDPSFAKMQMIRNMAIDMHKLRRANDYIDDVGVVHKDKTVGYTDDGRPIMQDEENTINVAYDRLNRTLTRQLKELGILDSPDKQDAEAKEDIANELSKLRKAREQSE